MADPVVHITNGVPDSGTGNITTLGQTLVDGANATMGITTGTAVTTDAAGTLQQYLRGLVKLIAAGINVVVSNANANGQAAMAASAPVVIASNQTSIPTAATIQPSTTDVAVVPTVTAGAYTAGFVLGGIMTFANILAATSFNGILQSITAKFKGAAVTGNLEVAIFKASPSNGTYTDHAAPTWNAADMANLLGIYTLTTANSKLGTMTVYNMDGIGKALAGASQSLFAVVIVDGTPTPASTADFTLELSVLPG